MEEKILAEKCNRFLDETMNLNDLPGIAIGVSIGGGSDPAEFIGVRGYRDYAARVPLREEDVFHCASVSKLFTSSAIMKLVETGALHLDDKLCDLLPDLRIADRRFRKIRLWHMLSHTAGLGDVSDYHWYDFETDEDSLRRYVYASAEVLRQPMLWRPQTVPEFQNPRKARFRYSNVAYEILGQIIAEYSDRMPGADGKLSYEDFVARHLLDPAGMTDSTMKTFARDIRHIAQPYQKQPDRSIGPVEHYPYTRQHAPSSTLTSTVCDLLRWGRAHLASSCGGGLLLKAETYQTVWRSYAAVPKNKEKMGLGWFLREQTVSAADGSGRTFRLCGHEGSDDGFRASFWICPELDTVTVVLSNLSGAPVKKINKKLFAAIV